MTDHAGRDVSRASGSIDAYLRQLERELRQGGYADARVMEEVREHLIDAVDDGLSRGLSAEDAEREAFERFGPPEAIAAHLIPGRHPMINRLVTLTRDVVWPHRWWILTPTVVTAILTSVLSYYYLPTRYRSETVIHILAPRMPAWAVAPSAAADRSRARVEFISQSILSSSRLESIIRDFGLYGAGRSSAPSADQILMMQRDIAVNLVPTPRPAEAVLAGLNVSFQSADPKLAMRITERLAALFLEENLRDREMQTVGESQFLDAELADVRRRLIELETSLEALRAQSRGAQVSQADLLPYEVLRERYRALLVRREEYRSASNLERRELGEQFRVAAAARLPERPVGPSRLGVNITGALMGLGIGLAVVGVKRRTRAD